MVNTTTIFRIGSVIGGMVASELVAGEVSKIVPIAIPFKKQAVQLGVGAGSYTLLGNRDGIVGTVGKWGAIGAFASGILGVLGQSFAVGGIQFAGAGEEEEYLEYAAAGEIEEVYLDEFGNPIAAAGEPELVHEDVAYNIYDPEPIL